MKTMDYLRLTKEKLGIESDYALAARLGVTRGTMSNFKRGRNFLGDDIAMQIAEILNKPREEVLFNVMLERAAHSPNKEVAAAWSNISHIMDKLSVGFKGFITVCAPRRVRVSAAS